MRHIYEYILAAAIAVTATQSCVSKIDPLFDESSANRAETLAEELNETLVSSPNGWLLQYYPSSGQYYGGFNVFLSFSEGNKVKAGSEVAGEGKTATSTYTIYQSAGCVLSFDSYNEVIHHFSDPEASGGQGAGYGYEGDFEFNVLDLQDDKIVLKGRKTGSRMTMTPMPISITWDEYINGVKEEEKAISKYDRLSYQTGDVKFDGRLNERSLDIYSEVNGEQVTTSHPFIVNLMGITFYEPVQLGDEIIEGLIYSPDMGDDGAFIPVNDGAEGYFVPTYPTITDYLLDKNWFFTYSGFSDYGKKLWDKAAAALKANDDDITYCYLGNTSNYYGDYYAFNFYCTKSGGHGYLAFDYEIKGEDRIALKFSQEGSLAGKNYYTSYCFNYVITPLGNEKQRTFTLSVDDIRNPQWIKFTDEEDKANYFTVYRATQYYPLNN